MKQTMELSFTEQVFEHRNKQFGAYEHRMKYSDHIFIAFIICISSISLAISIPVIYNTYFNRADEMEMLEEVEISLEKVEINEPIEETPPPPDIPLPEIATVKFLPPEIKPDNQVQEEAPPTSEELENSTASNVTKEGIRGENATTTQQVKAPEPEPEQQEVLAFVPVQAEFEGGNQALIKLLSSSIIYPEEAQKQGVSGDVWIQFTVNLDGSITEAKIFKGIGSGCDEVALNAVLNLPPKWSPGKVNGVAKRSKKKVKIHFGL